MNDNRATVNNIVLFRVRDIQRILGCSPRTANRVMKSIPESRKIGNILLVTEKDFWAWFNRQQ